MLLIKLVAKTIALPNYNNVITTAQASQIASPTNVYSTVYSGTDQKTSKHRVTSLCVGNSPVTGEFPTQKANNAENISTWWRHHETCIHAYKKNSQSRINWKCIRDQTPISFAITHGIIQNSISLNIRPCFLFVPMSQNPNGKTLFYKSLSWGR